MKNKIYYIILIILLLTLSQGKVSYADTEIPMYLDINLTRPLINKKSISLESMTGFSLYESNDKLNPIFEIEEESIKAVLNEDKDIDLIDLNGDVLFVIQADNEYLIRGNGIEENTIKVEKDRYRGYLHFKSVSGSIRVINHLDVEDYLYGLVPREMPSSFPLEALKAQAVAARTYAIYNIDKHKKDGYSLCDTTHCQVYSGYDGEKPSTTKAVDETRGMFALYNGNVINAQYCSSSSGYTNDSLDVWGGDQPYLKSVKDEYSCDAPHNKWDISIDLAELNKKLGANGINIGNLQSVEALEVTENGNVNSLILKGTLGEKEIKGSTFRNIIGNTELKSTNFNIKAVGAVDNIVKSKFLYVMDGSRNIVSLDIKKATIIDKYGRRRISNTANRAMSMDEEEDLDIGDNEEITYNSNITIEGKGYGHGVGMSQYGAKKMAELGFDFKDILKFYYTGIDIL